jgi:hypothetical protein
MPSVSWLLLLLLLLLLLELLLEPLLGSCWFTLLSSWFHSCSYTTAPLLPYINSTIKVRSATEEKSNRSSVVPLNPRDSFYCKHKDCSP